VSNKVPDNQQGELQGALTSLISVAAIIGPIVMTAVFYFFTNDSALIHFPGAPFFLGGLLMMLAWLMAHLTLKKLPEIK
jgi:DHA1 family tetracycline resistance protein-like MFS transporter